MLRSCFKMGYLVSVGNLCWELENMLKSNFGEEPNKKTFNKNFKQSKKEILERIGEIIDENKEVVKDELGLN